MSELHKTLGNLLKTERERQEIKIADIAEKLKISEANLAAIEEGDITKLPSEIYFSLFSKTYAEALGLDYSVIMDELKGNAFEIEETSKKAIGKKKADSADTESSETETDQKNFAKTALYAFGGIIVVFVLFLLINKFFFATDETHSSTESLQDMSSEMIPEKTESEMEALYADYDWESVVYEKPEKLVLSLISSEECWSAVFADGDTALYQNLRPNRIYTIDADYRILVSIGMPSKVTIKLNGQEVDLRDPGSRRIYKVLINQLNYKEFFNPQNTEKPASPPKPVIPAIDTMQTDNTISDSSVQQELTPNNTKQSDTEF